MVDKKIEKALYGPSLAEVAVGAALSLILGVVAACVYLVFKPVQQVKELPKEPSRSVVYYIPGAYSSAKSKGWQAKEKQLLDGKGITVVEDELNAWAVSLGVAPSTAKPAGSTPKPGDNPKTAGKTEAKVDGKAAPSDGFIIPAPLNFRIVGDKVQVGVKCALNWYGLTHDVTVLATGSFRKSGGAFEFAPDKVYLGSCPLHLLPAASGLLVASLTGKQRVSDELRVALTKLTDVTIEGGTVKLAVQ